MKKLIYFACMLAGLFMMTSCEKDEIGGTATQSLAGEWYVVADAVDANGNIVYEDFWGERFLVNTYNTAANTATEIWINDNNNFVKFAAKLSCDIKDLTFQSNGAAVNSKRNNSQVTVEGGKIVLGGAETPHGTKADYIEFYVSVSDDKYPAVYGFDKYKISGYRYTGLTEDD